MIPRFPPSIVSAAGHRLETSRLTLYAASQEQMRAFIAAQSGDALKAAYTEMLDGCLAHPDQWEWHAIWMVELKDGTHVGECCFKGLSEKGIAEIGYGVAEDHRGRGYATEAVAALVEWAFGRPDAACIQAETEASNIASRRVLEKAGFAPTGETGGEGPRFARWRPGKSPADGIREEHRAGRCAADEPRIVDLPEIAVIGKAGLCAKGHNIVKELWADANSRFAEVAALAMKNPDGHYAGFWGAMSDEALAFRPWTDGFTRGLYLAGVEVGKDAVPPPGWTKWTMPARRYLVVDVEAEAYVATFSRALCELLPAMHLKLAGAVCDYTEPATGRNRLFFPVEE